MAHGAAPKAAHPPQPQGIRSCHGTAAFWGHCVQHAAKFTLCLLPCTGMDQARDTHKYSTTVLSTPQGPKAGGTMAQKAPHPMEQG